MEIQRAFGKVQTSIEIFLVNQIRERGWHVDKDVIKGTMSHLISAMPLEDGPKKKAEVLVALMKGAPHLLEAFCHAIRVKIAILTHEGMAAEGLRIIHNLRRYGIQAVYVDSQPLSPAEFVSLSNDLVLLCNTLNAQKVDLDDDWAEEIWEGRSAPASLGEGTTVVRQSAAGKSVGDFRTVGGNEPNAGIGDMEWRAETLTDRYTILESLGRGGFGEVFKAHDGRLQRNVAVKRLLSSLSSQGDLQRFFREARAISALSHPNIVQVYDMSRDSEGYYIVMEYVEGGSLREFIKSHGGLPVGRACRLAGRICDAIEHAHARGVIHRDLKPSNILMCSAPTDVKVVDFGLAKSAAWGTSLSQTGITLGTPCYMPPEQLSDARQVDGTADIYALGKTLYEMATGAIPMDLDYDLLADLPGLEKIIRKCVKTDPKRRYQVGSELKCDLERLAAEGAA